MTGARAIFGSANLVFDFPPNTFCHYFTHFVNISMCKMMTKCVTQKTFFGNNSLTGTLKKLSPDQELSNEQNFFLSEQTL